MTDASAPSRAEGRRPEEMRAVSLETGVSRYAEGSCLVRFGHTRVLCTASVDNFVPPFLRNTGKGWVTAEYGMLPRATHSRNPREAAKGKQGGRTMEIQRLIGRSLRAVVSLEALGERQIVVDCDVIEADGGTRTASITGGYVAMAQAINALVAKGQIKRNPLLDHVAAISCGISKGVAVLDLDYDEDSAAEVDSNFVMTGAGLLVEVQGTAEHAPFSPAQLHSMLELAQQGIAQLVTLQKQALVRISTAAA